MSVTVRRVDGRAGVTEFVDVPFRLHGDEPCWTPPLRLAVRDLLDTRRNPFYAGADRALFVAELHGRPAGRIAAIENRWHNRHHDDRVGFFGFFDCVDDQEVADRLFAASEDWLRARELEVARGPMSPSMNHECGLLVDGYDVPAVLMTPWNPAYQPRLVEGAGYRGVQDLLGFYMSAGAPLPERLSKLAERTRRQTGVTFRAVDVSRLEREARLIRDLYCDAWSTNWGFVPPSWEEFWYSAKDLKTVLATDYSFVAEAGGEVVGFFMVAKDLNRVLRTIPSGRLWPWNVAKLLLGVRRVRNHRVILLGVRASHRNRGLMALFTHEAVRRGRESGEEGAEASWILDDNELLIGPLTALGYEPYKRWRIYDRPL